MAQTLTLTRETFFSVPARSRSDETLVNRIRRTGERHKSPKRFSRPPPARLEPISEVCLRGTLAGLFRLCEIPKQLNSPDSMPNHGESTILLDI